MATLKTEYNTVAGLTKALRKLPKNATVELRKSSQTIASKVAAKARARGTAQGGLNAIVASTIRPGSDRVPLVRMGNSTRLPPRNGFPRKGNRQTIGDVMWGAEFGGGRRPTTQQFAPWRGNSMGAGYFLWPTVREESDEIMVEYSDALLDALRETK